MTWQPIEAAPKDGTLVDLWCVGCSDIYEAKPIRLTDCSWHNADDIFNFTGWVRICDDGHWDAVEMDAACELGLPAWTPTHWTLPPAAPGSQPTEQPPQADVQGAAGHVLANGLNDETNQKIATAMALVLRADIDPSAWNTDCELLNAFSAALRALAGEE